MWKNWFRTYRIQILLFILLWTTYTYFYQSTGSNEAVRFDQMRALVEDHTLAIDKYCFNSPDLIRYPNNGRIYPNKAPGMTFVGIVPFVLFSILLRPLTAIGLPEWVYWHLLNYLIVVLTVSLPSALAGVAMYRLLKKLSGGDNYFSALTVLAIWLGTLVFPYSTLFYSHVMAGSFLVIAFYLLFELGSNELSIRRSNLLCIWAAGLLMGCSVAIEYPTALLAAILGIYALRIVWQWRAPMKEKGTVLGMFMVGLAMGGAILVFYNLSAFGNIFYIPYQAYATPGSAFHSGYARGWMGMHGVSRSEFLNALASVLLYRPMGLLYINIERWHVSACNPILWLSLPGFVIMIWNRKLRPEGLVVTAMVIIYILFICTYGSSIYDWGGGLYFGPRHLIPVIPFLALPLYFGARKLRPVFYVLAAISIFYMLLDTAVEPRISFPYGDPAHEYLLTDYLHGQLAQNIASLFDQAHRYLTNDSTAANLAKIAHIPGRLQLAPLMLWWIILGAFLFYFLKQKQERFWSAAPIVLSLLVGFVVFAPLVHHAMTVIPTSDHGLLAKYYRNANWKGSPVDIEIDRAVDFDWTTATPYPPPFSVEWTGDILVERPGLYEFILAADDGATLEIDGRTVVDASHAGGQGQPETVSLPGGLHPIRVRYFNQRGGGSVKLSWSLIGRPRHAVPNEALVPEMTRQHPVYHAVTAPGTNGHGLLGKFYRNVDWSGPPVDVEIDPVIDFDWAQKMPYPAPFSVEWSGNLRVDQPGNYEFTLVADDGAVLQIDGKQVVDASHSLLQEKSQSIFLQTGLHPIRVRYFNSLFGGAVRLWWSLEGRPRQIVPNEVLIPE